MSNLIQRADGFASWAHFGQERKYTGEPYIVHPREVMNIVKTVPHTEEMLAAALLHDVVEDTSVTLLQIQVNFGSEIASLVNWLTCQTTPKDGNRKKRKAMDAEFLASAPADAQTVKVADLISNTKSIVDNDPKFAVVYLKEKADLIEVLTKADETLVSAAKFILWESKLKLEKLDVA